MRARPGGFVPVRASLGRRRPVRAHPDAVRPVKAHPGAVRPDKGFPRGRLAVEARGVRFPDRQGPGVRCRVRAAKVRAARVKGSRVKGSRVTVFRDSRGRGKACRVRVCRPGAEPLRWAGPGVVGRSSRTGLRRGGVASKPARGPTASMG
ncbi:hypothetical protein [Paractinoplanes atraurantiacus]|uniref:hypothetical protein n=1 Tax=Paractinoplanes atraurantiacus TaxID=1036182 RepID=UPI0015CF3D98|nr:hypothetical protein [Actinoplanes atraurantiacus]